jgi:hypothetical protein
MTHIQFNRYNILKTSAALASVLTFAQHSVAADSAVGSQPNIIVILTDDQGFGQLGCQGHPWLETPNIDTLCAQSTSFTAFHVSPTCSPTRSALLTGNVPFRNGVTHTVEPRNRMALSAVTIPQYLKKVGYTSGIFGKWHLGLAGWTERRRRLHLHIACFRPRGRAVLVWVPSGGYAQALPALRGALPGETQLSCHQEMV